MRQRQLRAFRGRQALGAKPGDWLGGRSTCMFMAAKKALPGVTAAGRTNNNEVVCPVGGREFRDYEKRKAAIVNFISPFIFVLNQD